MKVICVFAAINSGNLSNYPFVSKHVFFLVILWKCEGEKIKLMV